MPGPVSAALARPRDETVLHRFEAMQLEVRVLISTEDAGGTQCLTEFLFHTPFAGPPPHWHRTFSETFVCLEGEFTVIIDGVERVLRAGDVALVPPHTLHSYRVEHHGPTRYLLVCTPGCDFDRYVADAAALAHEAHRHRRPVDLEVLRDLRGRHQTYDASVPFF